MNISLYSYLAELFQFLVCIPAAILCFIPLRNQLVFSLRKTALIVFSSLAALIPVMAAVCAFTPLSANQILFAAMFLFFLTFHRMQHAPLSASLSCFLLVVSLMSFPATLSMAFDICLHPSLFNDITYISTTLFQLLVSLAIAFGICPLLWKCGAYLIDNLPWSADWYKTLLVPAIFIFINFILEYFAYPYLLLQNLFYLYTIYLGAQFLLLIIIYTIFYFIAKSMIQGANREEQIRLLEMQLRQYKSQQNYIRHSSRLRHDFRQSVIILSQLAQSENIPALKSYIEELSAANPTNEVFPYCENTSVNALLNYYASNLDQNQIRRNWKITLPNEMSIADIELCGLLGNILENVCRGCLTEPSDKRFHNLSILLLHEKDLYIASTNNFDGIVHKKEHAFLTSRKDGQGIGLSSIAYTAKIYRGMSHFSANGHEFIIDVLLDIQSPKKE